MTATAEPSTRSAGSARRPELGPDLLARLGRHVQSSGARLDVLEPFTGKPLCEVPASTVEDVTAAFGAARAAQVAWARRPVKERTAVLARFHELLLEERDLMLDLLQAEGGKARRTAMEELCDPLLVINHYGHGSNWAAVTEQTTKAMRVLRRLPF